MAEEEKKPMTRAERLYSKSTAKEPDAAREPRKEPEREAARKPEPKETEGGDMRARHVEARHAMRKAHETERRDLHGQHREEHRQMATRHENAMGDLMDQQEGEMAGGEAEPMPAAEPGA